MSTLADFNPDDATAIDRRKHVRSPDGSAYVPYLYDPAGTIILHVRIALATGRPLLLSGLPGGGKSTLARDVALCLGWRYYERVITSRTQARDLQWRWDAVGRLADAQGAKQWLSVPNRFVEPEVLWWAYAPQSARSRGVTDPTAETVPPATDPQWQFTRDGEIVQASPTKAVVLLDEIDKADPDVPNDLLVALGERRFVVEETRDPIEPDPGGSTLVFITTNGERDLPQAFLRRCITLTLDLPRGKAMEAIVERHVPDAGDGLIKTILQRYEGLVEKSDASKARPPGTAELIDAIRAASSITQRYGAQAPEAFERILHATLWKRPEPMPPPAPPVNQPENKRRQDSEAP